MVGGAFNKQSRKQRMRNNRHAQNAEVNKLKDEQYSLNKEVEVDGFFSQLNFLMTADIAGVKARQE